MATIQIIRGPEKERTFALVDDENVIGRQGDTVQIADTTISRRHAQMVKRDNRWFIEDLGSANGTYLNGVKVIRPMAMNRGDQVRIGATLFVFADGDGTEGPELDIDEEGNLVDAAIMATVPSNEDSVVMPSPQAGVDAIANLRILYDLINDVASIFNVDLLLRHTLDKVFDVLKADRGHIMLINKAGKLVAKASRVSGDLPTGETSISRTIIDHVVANKVGVLSSNAMSDKRFASGKSVHDFGIRSAVCAPIPGRDRILGVIHIDSSVAEHTYTTEQLRLLTAIGYQTGLAIENVEMYEAAVQTERLAAVGETVAFLSHHIKNILQALGAGVDVVEAAMNRDDLTSAKGSWPIVQRSLGRINGLILNMLAFSKDREPLLEPTNINHVLRECIEIETPRADERGVALMADLDDMPPVPADGPGLQQAFMNLITNAIDAVPDNKGIVTVASKYDTMNRVVVVRVMDNGRGIPRDLLGGIFKPFYSSKGQRGTGLGLAVTRKIVLEHQGTIDVRSEVGQGTTFTVTISAMARYGGDSGDTSMPVGK